MLFGNLKEIYKLIISDWEVFPHKKHGGGGLSLIICALTCRHPTFCYQFWLRLASKPSLFYPIAKWKHIRLTRKYGIQIPTTTRIGKSFTLWHGCGIVINPDTVIGDNVTIFHFCSIGASKKGAAKIGNNVWIGPHVCIVEDVVIGNDVKIGAGTVVIHDIPDHCTSVGNPNRNIPHN